VFRSHSESTLRPPALRRLEKLAALAARYALPATLAGGLMSSTTLRLTVRNAWLRLWTAGKAKSQRVADHVPIISPPRHFRQQPIVPDIVEIAAHVGSPRAHPSQSHRRQ
jgi:hypothetical protein